MKRIALGALAALLLAGSAHAQGYVNDVQSQAFQGEVILTVGTPDSQPRRSLKAICSVAGNVAVTYGDGSIGVWPVVVGTQTLPISILTVNTSGTTATCTYANLK